MIIFDHGNYNFIRFKLTMLFGRDKYKTGGQRNIEVKEMEKNTCTNTNQNKVDLSTLISENKMKNRKHQQR